jgi:hypothetical protein
VSDALIHLDPDSGLSLQNQIRQKLVDAIMSGAFPPGERLRWPAWCCACWLSSTQPERRTA